MLNHYNKQIRPVNLAQYSHSVVKHSELMDTIELPDSGNNNSNWRLRAESIKNANLSLLTPSAVVAPGFQVSFKKKI